MTTRNSVCFANLIFGFGVSFVHKKHRGILTVNSNVIISRIAEIFYNLWYTGGFFVILHFAESLFACSKTCYKVRLKCFLIDTENLQLSFVTGVIDGF